MRGLRRRSSGLGRRHDGIAPRLHRDGLDVHPLRGQIEFLSGRSDVVAVALFLGRMRQHQRRRHRWHPRRIVQPIAGDRSAEVQRERRHAFVEILGIAQVGQVVAQAGRVDGDVDGLRVAADALRAREDPLRRRLVEAGAAVDDRLPVRDRRRSNAQRGGH